MAQVLEITPKSSTKSSDYTHIFSHILSGFGAFGTALQNYPAVNLFINEVFKNIIAAGKLSKTFIQLASLGAGGICSGMVNFWMNVELLDGFFERFNSGFQYKKLKLTAWQKLQYFGGIFIFLVTGILFGLMAFAFAMEGPLAILSIAAGLFVAIIMTIQEVETWLSSYDKSDTSLKKPLTQSEQIGKWCGHIIAVGNVLALSLLFTLGLAQSLIALNVAAFPALIAGLTIAFTFGAFTEYFFYNFYLANFCKNLKQNWTDMMAVPHAWFGILCIATNAFVNAALTYSGVTLLTGLLIAAHITLPPLAIITALAATSAFFAGSASWILGTAFWIRQHPKNSQEISQKLQEIPPVKKVSTGISQLSMFAANKNAYAKSEIEEAPGNLIVQLK